MDQSTRAPGEAAPPGPEVETTHAPDVGADGRERIEDESITPTTGRRSHGRLKKGVRPGGRPRVEECIAERARYVHATTAAWGFFRLSVLRPAH